MEPRDGFLRFITSLMNIESLKPAVLKKVIALLEKREHLQKLIEEMNQQIAALISAEEESEVSATSRKSSARRSKAPRASKAKKKPAAPKPPAS